MTLLDLPTLRRCLAEVARTSTPPKDEDLDYRWGWKDACALLDKRLRRLVDERQA